MDIETHIGCTGKSRPTDQCIIKNCIIRQCYNESTFDYISSARGACTELAHSNKSTTVLAQVLQLSLSSNHAVINGGRTSIACDVLETVG